MFNRFALQGLQHTVVGEDGITVPLDSPPVAAHTPVPPAGGAPPARAATDMPESGEHAMGGETPEGTAAHVGPAPSDIVAFPHATSAGAPQPQGEQVRPSLADS
jgi:hypothetical protein